MGFEKASFSLMCPGLKPSAFVQRPEENVFAISTHQVTHEWIPNDTLPRVTEADILWVLI